MSVVLCVGRVVIPGCFSLLYVPTSLPLCVIRVMLVCAPRMLTVAVSASVVTVAVMLISLLMPSISTLTLPSLTSLRASRLSLRPTPSRHSSPFPASAATYPSAAQCRLPTSVLLGMPQVKAFLYIPLLSFTCISLSVPFTYFLAVATAKAMAPGSVTPSAGRISSYISRVSLLIWQYRHLFV